MTTTAWIVITLATVVIALIGPHHASQELILQKCLPKADMENIVIKCNLQEMIAIKTAFFTSSVVDQCPFAYMNKSAEEAVEQSNAIAIESGTHLKAKRSCTDDLRMTLNSRCSGRSNCTVNLRKMHHDRCPGFDGWINIKYTCVSPKRLHQYCNLDLTDHFGYVTNPGYPKFYPPYVCKWKIRASPGQGILIEILDLAIKEPRSSKQKLLGYECIDQLSVVEENAKVIQLCGDVKSNLLEYRSKGNQLTVEFLSHDFSPSRGVLFKYSLQNCPTLKAPANGYMIRNGSLAYYWCVQDQVFETDGQPNLVLFCELDTYWNGSVPRCVPKENVTVQAYALTNSENLQVATAAEWAPNDASMAAVFKHHYIKGMIAPLCYLIGTVVLIVAIIVLTIAFRKRKDDASTRTAV